MVEADTILALRELRAAGLPAKTFSIGLATLPDTQSDCLGRRHPVAGATGQSGTRIGLTAGNRRAAEIQETGYG